MYIKKAKHVTFVENYNKVLKFLKKILIFKNNKCKIIEKDCFEFFKKK